ncbi:MAG: hypothetical protein EP332_00280 [Bacteroidetes bacterium]|nr:MAG: hypothetical protein EP332_00280 [Bacteroidota bacterium]
MHKQLIIQILEDNYARATVFEFFGIAYPNYLNESLEQVAAYYGLDIQVLADALEQIKGKSPVFDYNYLELPVLISYLKFTHHEYARAKLPHIKKNMELLGMEEELAVFQRFSRDLQKHILLEEKVIFPFILNLHELLEEFDPRIAAQVVKENSTEVLCASHTTDDDEMRELREVTSGYTYQSDDSIVKKVLMTDLKRLEEDIHVHANIEDDILFRKAKLAEKQVKERLQSHYRNN